MPRLLGHLAIKITSNKPSVVFFEDQTQFFIIKTTHFSRNLGVPIFKRSSRIIFSDDHHLRALGAVTVIPSWAGGDGRLLDKQLVRELTTEV